MVLKDKRLPSYPLMVKDPYFSFWMPADDPTESDVAFWHGEPKPFAGVLTVDGKEYRFLGKGEQPALRLVQTEVTAFDTIYTFDGDDFTFAVDFFSPLPPSDPSTMSLPAVYVNYTFTSKVSRDVSVSLAMEERACFDTCRKEERTEEMRVNKYVLPCCQTVSMGLLRQLPLSNSMDEVGADWGYIYLCGQTADSVRGERVWTTVRNDHNGANNVSGFFVVAFDDIISIFYFGQYLPDYWQRNGKNIFDVIAHAYSARSEILHTCQQFEHKLLADAACYSDDYLITLYASVRQSVAAHKLVQDKDGNLLFLSKECNSDGCIATVDVTYPSMPMYLLYNPELVKGMILPIFKFARMAVWNKPFAPHDVGIYPYCLGQYYAVKNGSECRDMTVHSWAAPEVLPFYYQLPADYDLFDFNRQMPVEESGNMIIVTWLYYAVSGDKQILEENFDLFETWVKYLVKYGLVPDCQLCTDDFAGHLDKNANLAVKSIVGMYCFAKMAEALNKPDLSAEYYALASNYAGQWKSLYNDGDHTMLCLDNHDSYSLKYNMAIDKLLGAGLFDDDIVDKELRYYDKVAGKYGVPLDTRNTYTKTDWMLWVAALGDNTEVNKYASYIVNFFADTTQRVPFSDWIDTKEPKYYTFRNRTVQGGLFLPILKAQWSELCKTK